MRLRQGCLITAAWTLGVLFSVAPSHASEIESAFRRAIHSADLGNTTVGLCVVDADTGDLLADLGADELLIPASNMKLLTTAAALQLLGADFAFTTTLGVIEPARPSELPALVIRGSGDPAFGDPMLLEQEGFSFEFLIDAWVKAVEATGHKRFEQLIIDDRVFDDQRIHPDWPVNQLHKDYCAEVAGLNFYCNVLDITPIPADAPGKSPRITVYPEMPFLVTSNRAKTGKNDLFHIHRTPGTNDLFFRGSIRHRPASPWHVTVHDPPMLFGQLLSHELAKRGIEVLTIVRAGEQDLLSDLEPIHRVETRLPAILARTNRDSQNLFAEALFKRMGQVVTGTRGSWHNGAAAMRLFLRDRLGTRSATIQVADGSGLSRNNRVTARLITNLLREMYSDVDPEQAAIYRASLAYAGRDATGEYTGTGTFRRGKRFSGLPAGHQVFGKSGYINGVSSLSGYVVIDADKTGRPRTIVFSLLFNGFKPPVYNSHLKSLQNDLIEIIDQSVSGNLMVKR